eukprot:TRINITY_DN7275_c0_g2_i3.p1 TRINITY_DN7275_c0_g2~~TRINITY_DN7275_c0_g2_i3.p1  ORF type:complete len:454 (-),score=156.78 TRINITY_DN7275_c0_g2_i3:51-1412(-)
MQNSNSQVQQSKEDFQEDSNLEVDFELQSSSSETSESEEDESEDETVAFDTKNQNEVLETLLKLKQKDPSIYDQNSKFYSSEEFVSVENSSQEQKNEEEDEENAEKTTSGKPMLLRDLHAEMILQGGEKALEEKELEYEKQRPKTTNLLYDDQQRENLEQFQSIVQQQLEKNYENKDDDNNDDDDDLLNFVEIKPQKFEQNDPSNLEAVDGENYFDNYKRKADSKNLSQQNQQSQEAEEDFEEKQKKISLLKEVFNEQDEKERFLKDYLLNERWKGFHDEGGDSDGGDDKMEGGGEMDDEGIDFWEDEQQIEQADYFEQSYNFRFEEEGKNRLVSFPREAPNSVREKKGRKKRQREARAARQEEQQQQQERELKRQKNIKTKEIKQMVEQIQKEAGGSLDTDKLMNALLSGGDLTSFYNNLDAVFDENYYKANDQRFDQSPEEREQQDQEEWD